MFFCFCLCDSELVVLGLPGEAFPERAEAIKAARKSPPPLSLYGYNMYIMHEDTLKHVHTDIVERGKTARDVV